MQNALNGIKVLDLSTNLPGPFLIWLMAEMVAEVLKVENPDTVDSA
jgi:crotonobetainyl-CoA:carnitine CoA-transferase CaiB-like acyl-CoA transferase